MPARKNHADIFVGTDGEGGAHSCFQCPCEMFSPVAAEDYCLDCKHTHTDSIRKCEDPKCKCTEPEWYSEFEILCKKCDHFHSRNITRCEIASCRCRHPRFGSESCACGHDRSCSSKAEAIAGSNKFGHSHEYTLLRAGDEYLYTGKPIPTQDALEWFCTLPRHGRQYVSYFFGYDSTMILRDIAAERMLRIISKEGRAKRQGNHGQALPVSLSFADGSEYEADYLPGKMIKVRRAGEKDWLEISDLGTFFQQSFVATLESWNTGTKAQQEIVIAGKRSRGAFVEMTETEIEYNRIECVLLEALAEEFRDVCKEVTDALQGAGIPVNIVPDKWQGPGRMAVSMFKRAGITKAEDLNIPYHVLPVANACYYGGRFETTITGQITGNIYEYDRNSAYPYAMLSLPCLKHEHGTWKRENKRPTGATVWAANVHFRGADGRYVYGLPIRDGKTGSIYWPQEGNGTYWNTEIEAAERLGMKVDVTGEVIAYYQTCKCVPFSWVENVYQERLKHGKTKRGKSLKLAINSLYGKLAQSIGKPPFANPVWAGLITAHMRASLLDAVSMLPSDRHVIMFATDAIFTDAKLNMPGTLDGVTDPADRKRLGDWSAEDSPYDGMFIIQPGLYLLGGELPKTRGIPRTRFTDYIDDFKDAWKTIASGAHAMPFVNVQLSIFRAAGQALNLNRWETAGQWFSDSHKISFDWRTKRSDDAIMCSDAESGLFYMRTLPKEGAADLYSKPYDKHIGGWVDDRESMREMFEGQPDGGGLFESAV